MKGFHGARSLALAGLLAGITGCCGAPTSPAPVSPPASGPASRPASAPASRPARKEPAFRGRPLSDWTRQFQETEDYGARVQASEALAAMGAPAVPALVEALADPELRFLAAVALKSMGPAAVAGLVKAMEDPDEEIRIAVIGVLGGIGPDARAAVPALMERVRRGEPMERWAALEALGNIGPAARAAVPLVLSILERKGGAPLPPSQKIRALKVLEGLLRDENELVRQAAASVLRRIRGEKGKPPRRR